MSRFQSGGWSNDEASSTPAGGPKPPLHPTLSSGPAVQKKPVLGSLSGSAISTPPKPVFLKNTVSSRSDTDAQEPNKTKALASRFANTQEDTNSKPFIGNKQQITPKPFSQPPEGKGPVQKPPLNKPSLSSTVSDSKPAIPKLTPSVSSKPSWVKEDSGGDPPSTASSVPKPRPLQQKPSSTMIKLLQQNEEQTNTDTVNKAPPAAPPPFKPSSNFKNAHSMFNKEKDKNEPSDNSRGNKMPVTTTNSVGPPKLPATKKPSLKGPSMTSQKPSGNNDDATSGPKRNPLKNSLALGPAPAKPNRPPRVNLENFKRDAEAPGNGELDFGLCLLVIALVFLYK